MVIRGLDELEGHGLDSPGFVRSIEINSRVFKQGTRNSAPLQLAKPEFLSDERILSN